MNFTPPYIGTLECEKSIEEIKLDKKYEALKLSNMQHINAQYLALQQLPSRTLIDKFLSAVPDAVNIYQKFI